MEKIKIVTFQDLIVWQKGHRFVLAIYKCTESFPQKETFGLTIQMRRAAVSITSNIAEGFSRKSKKEKSQFYYVALGSTTELENQILIARDLFYIKDFDAQILFQQTIEIHKLLNGLIKSLQR